MLGLAHRISTDLAQALQGWSTYRSADELMTAFPVRQRVNAAGHDGPELIGPTSEVGAAP